MAEEVGIEITAKDLTKKGFKSAAKNAETLEIKTKNVGKTVNELPGSFAKASGALSLYSTATSGAGAATAGAIGKIADIATLVASGGPFGIAIAAATVAMAAFALATAEADRRAEAAATQFGNMRDRLVTIADQNKKTAEARSRTPAISFITKCMPSSSSNRRGPIQ